MLNIFIHGTDKQGITNRKIYGQRRVDVGTGRLVAPAETRSRSRTSKTNSFALVKMALLPKLLIAAVILVAAVTLFTGCASQPAVSAANNAVEIESVRITAAGHYIDLRYHVLDPEYANEVLGPGVKPLLIDEASGTVMAVPTTAKLGSLRQTRGIQKTDHSYFVLFVNSAGLTSGSRVTAELGDMRFESLTIE